MMRQDEIGWSQRIVDFPLVAMMIAVLLYALATLLAIFIKSLLPHARPGFEQGVEALLTVGIGWFAYKVAIRHLGEEPRDDLPARGALKGIGLGLITGALLFGSIVGVAAIVGSYRIVGCCSTQSLASDLFGTSILPGFMEELLFRGILFRWIEEFAGSWAALVITAALFGVVHIMNPNASWFSSLALALEAGVMLGGAYMLTRNLWMPIGLHAAWNFTQGFIFGVPVSGVTETGLVQSKLSGPALISGGAFGLEASVIAVLIATTAGLAFVVIAARSGRLVRPWWDRQGEIGAA